MGRVPPPRTVKKLERKAVREIADHGVFRVREHTYPALGRPIYTYSCPDWCNVVAETDEGEIVLVWQYRFGTDELSLEIPGGVVDPGEAPEIAAARELCEETGYVANELELLGVVDPNPALQDNKCFSYFARGVTLSGKTAFDEIEDLELALVPKENLAALLDTGQITHALVLSALETYLRRHG